MKVPINNPQAQLNLLRSRFIGHLIYVEDVNDVKTKLDAYKKQYYDAHHLPYAYILDEQQHFDDDGEPSGSAGAPLLMLLKSAQCQHTLLVVARYFGGTKLGTTRLKGAFKEVGKQALNQVSWGQISPISRIRLMGPVEEMSFIYRFAQENDATIADITYNNKIDVCLMMEQLTDYQRQLLISHNWQIVSVQLSNQIIPIKKE